MNELRAKFTLNKTEPIKAKFTLNLTPTKVSQLENDLGFVRREEVVTPDFDLSNLATKDELQQGLETKQPKGDYASPNDIPDISNLASKTELEQGLETKQPKGNYTTQLDVMQMIASIPQFKLKVVTELPTTGEKMTLYLVPKEGSGNDVYNEYVWIEEVNSFEFIGTTAVDLTDYALKSEIVKDFQVPIVYGGLSTSTTNISYDNNGKAYLNDVAYYSTISECLPTEPIANYEKRSSFYDTEYTNGNCRFEFYKLKGYTEKYPILNLDGYNAILHNFSVGDIVMADSIKPFSGDYNDVQMCFGKIENDGTFVPKLMCRTYGWSDGVRFAKITKLYEPDEAYKRGQEWRMSSSFDMGYYNDVSRMTLSYKNQSAISDIGNIRGVKFIEKDNAISVAWVRENGEVVELSDTLTFDKIDFNCVIFNGYVYDNSNVTDTGIYGFDPTKYYVANGTIDNVIVRMIDGTGFKALGLNYKEADFEVVENKLSLKTKIQPISEADFEALENKDSNTLYLIEE